MSTKSKEQECHIQEMKERLLKKGGSSMDLFVEDSLALDMKEKILQSILSMEEAEERSLFDYFEEEGVSLPQSESLNDEQVKDKLWEVIQAMADLNQYLYHTDHLSNRQLYEALWNDILREETFINPDDDCSTGYIDILGGCSEEDCQNRLKYYAEEDERENWAEQYPEDAIPDHVDPPWDRDRHLPGPRDFL